MIVQAVMLVSVLLAPTIMPTVSIAVIAAEQRLQLLQFGFQFTGLYTKKMWTKIINKPMGKMKRQCEKK